MFVDCAWYVGLCLYLSLLIVDNCWFGGCFSIWVDWCGCWFTIIVLPAAMLYLYCYVLGVYCCYLLYLCCRLFGFVVLLSLGCLSCWCFLDVGNCVWVGGLFSFVDCFDLLFC